MRLVDADALWEIFREKQNSLTARCGGYRFLDGEDRAKYDRLEITLAYIENAPEVDAVPVVRGEWIMDTDPDDGDCRCSNCLVCIDALHRRNHDVLNALGYKLHTFYKYCPNCGAKMEDKP